ncbi:Smc5-Smc6 complex subunit NSE1 Ecym_5076 [Eremothecium cymbalariae DBVPG|uniref:Non-structural maintenance of chromosomes element 1 homolog n=1 Tax=Eremothecium cymbalariae (strain CBS 270.75 / DBVPG 7215 / KCTC 17166 / NRRL Y-17582) TaxID=931890 RepID=I6NCS4_ERECY|nr:hypothetical protein Ecym_5076 [Eremothecium cymbalariae DBVPG\
MIEEAAKKELSTDVKRKLLLQYILRSRGILHENVLLTCLLQLEQVDVTEEGFDEDIWLERLSHYISEINLKLSKIHYKVIKISHGMGKNYVTQKVMSNFDNEWNLRPSSRFYVYVNLNSTKETELATTLRPSEIEFVKWTIEKLATLKGISQSSSSENCPVELEIDRILKDWYERTEHETVRLPYRTTYTFGSMHLMAYTEFSSSEVEKLLSKLCELKWLYRTDKGSYGLDLKLLLEMEEYLLETHSMTTCESCQRIVNQGVLCTGCVANQTVDDDETELTAWHVDCFEYHLKHISQNCNKCESDILKAGAYLV